MSDSGRAVFLSYASQDGDAARKICAALRGTGVEVWFDQSELGGGDTWDAKIRKQIKECALFVPVISRHTQERLEGYFRLEWHLAERRMQQMHEDATFLLPVVIDPIDDQMPRVPEKFFDVQWTRFQGGEPTAAFAERVVALLGDDIGPTEVVTTAPRAAEGTSRNGQSSPLQRMQSHSVAYGPVAEAAQADGTSASRTLRLNPRDLVFNRSAAMAGCTQTNAPMDPDKVLIVEDDPTMQRVLKDNFEFNGYEVRIVADGRQGLQAVFDWKPDLILLDIMLPEVNGFDVCRRIRKEGLTTPIIMLTAKSQESDIVLGLNLGADDYVAKPFSIDVLLARATACLRRQQVYPADVFEFGDCRFDAQSHKLFRSGTEVLLTPKEFRLLAFFMAHLSRALTREQILNGVWGEGLIVTDRSVDRCITTLRNKIELDPQHPRFIMTIRDVGYRFEIKK